MIEVVLFDWGGTLSDVSGQPAALHEGARRVTEILFGRADPALAQALALAAMDAESRSAADPSHREVDLRNLLNTWATTQGMIPEVHRLDEAIEAIGACWVGRALGPIPGALDTLAWLRERGLRLGLVSNVWLPPRFCRQELTRQGLEPRLDFAVFSSQVGYRKPSPAIYEAALKEAFPAARPDDLSSVLFVGDSPLLDVAAPAAMGMKTALVDSKPGFWPAKDLVSASPDLHLETVADLPALLEGVC